MKIVVTRRLDAERKAHEVVQATRDIKGRWSGSRADGHSAMADTPEELADMLGGSR